MLPSLFSSFRLSDVILTCIFRYSKFQSVANITLHFPESFGGDTTQIHYIGFKGEATQVLPLTLRFTVGVDSFLFFWLSLIFE